MRDPYVSAAKWLTGRLIWLLVIMAFLVLVRLYADESRLLLAQLRGMAPDAELLASLENGRQALQAFSREREQAVRRRLDDAAGRPTAWIDRRMASVGSEIEERQARSRTPVERTLALLTGGDFRRDFENDIEIRLLTAELGALERIRKHVERERASLGAATQAYQEARRRILRVYGNYEARREELARLERDHPVAVLIPGTSEHRLARDLEIRIDRLLVDGDRAADDYYAARDALRELTARVDPTVELLDAAGGAVLEPLEELIVVKREELAAAEHRMRQLEDAVRAVFFPALVILVAITFSPVAVKAFWYFIVAPAAARRPPVRLLPQVKGALCAPAGEGVTDAPRRSVSAVSQSLSVDERHEALIHPAFLQSSSIQGRKDTRWLLDWRYPFTSLASGMVALTRIEGSHEDAFVVSSKNDPFSEIGVLVLPAGSAMALQPRNLVGVVQERDQPVAIESHWRLGRLTAWLTLQLRFLVFHGPVTLIVQGCRGVRVERAASGRSIDQAATIGFTANLDYSTTRSETFGAYLLGEHGLFNDNFAGGPGHYVYEEMPYFGRKTGITGRGLEGLTDAVLKAFGI